MRKIILFLLFINLYSFGDAQIIRGTIRDQNNDSTIIFASVYINGTSVGSHSDQNGNFKLDITKYRLMPLTVSALGYYSATITEIPKSSQFVVYLTPKLFELREVVISSKPSAGEKERKRNLKLFRNEFLGSTSNAVNCEITNENAISFAVSPDDDTLKAWSSEPLIIENRSLGYTITYFLDKFAIGRTNNFLIITGNYIFKEDTTTDLAQKEVFAKKRKAAYMGSRMHFFRALWDNSLESAGFTILNSSYRESVYEEIVIEDISGNSEPVKFLMSGGTLNINYSPKFDRTQINPRQADVFFDKSGYFDPYGISWSGDMGKQRIADLLPFDYTEEIKMEKIKIEQGISISDTASVIEKVYLHSDRTYYYPGDDIWFKAYLIEADSRLLMDHSNNLHVDLISPSLKIIESRVIRIDAGLGNGDLRLPVELPSGRYLLRAYTNYMRNFSENLFFKREIIVVGQTNPESNPNVETVTKENRINMGFFPEGGSLLDNVSTIVAFKAVDAIGRGCEVSGEVYASTGELITKFKSTYQGMGTFFLKPFPGIKYYSVVRSHNGVETKSAIPGSLSSGVTMAVSKTGGNDLKVTVKTNTLTLPSLLGDNLLLSISARKKVLKTINFKIKSVTNSFTIGTDDLPAGIVMLTLSNNSGLPVSERLIFIQKDKDVAISIEPDKREYEKRDPVSLRISLTADSGLSRETYLSVSAAERGSDSTYSEFSSSISSWFLLESDVHGIIEEPSYYFNPANLNRSSHLDLLLRTQGWRDFTWKYDKKYYFNPETGFSISGRVRSSFSNKSLDYSEVNIGIFEKKETYFTTIPTDTSGRFSLKGIDLTGEARVIVTSIGSKDHPRGMIVLDSSDYAHAGIIGTLNRKRQLFLEEDFSEIKQEYEIKEAIRKKYKLSDTIALGEVAIIATRAKNLQEIKVENSRAVYGEPDDEIIITRELESYRNAIEILKGRVPGVQVSGSYPDYEIKIRGTHTMGSNATPLVLIDGFRKDFSDLMTMPLHFIDRIDVLKSGGATAMYGFSGANGVISIITRTADRIVPGELPKYSANFIFSGYNEARIFFSPQYTNASASGYGPDLRTTLFWKPDISLKSNQDLVLNYYNADNTSTIRVVVEGITSDGIPVTGSTEYEIR